MPAHKRSSPSENLHEEDSAQPRSRRKQSRRERGADEHEDREEEEDEREVKDEEQDAEGDDSDGSRSSDDPANLPEWLLVQLPALRTYVQCPICLGIIKKTRTVMECLHRFCRECIDKSMRMGNNECPACRTHCASRRSLRDDPRFDSLIEILYEDIEKYEEEELAFHEEERSRNKQIQASIAQIFRRQSEALVTRSKRNKDTASPSTGRVQRSGRKYTRRRRNPRGTEHEGSEDNEDDNNHEGTKDSSSAEERGTETKQRRYKRRSGAHSSLPSQSTANSDGGGHDNDAEANKESRVTIAHVRNTEMLAWGGGGARSRSRNTRISKLTKYLENLKEDEEQLDINLMLISLDKQRTQMSQPLYLRCSPSLTVEGVKEFVSGETKLWAEHIEVVLVKHHRSADTLQSALDLSASMDEEVMLQILEGEETLASVIANCSLDRNCVILAYRLKERRN